MVSLIKKKRIKSDFPDTFIDNDREVKDKNIVDGLNTFPPRLVMIELQLYKNKPTVFMSV